MQLAAVAPITKPFTISISDTVPDIQTTAIAKLGDIAAKHGVTLSPVASTGFVFETMPLQADLSGTVTGGSAAVDSALAAIELLGQAI
ncbi:MAG: hypothetical protein JWM86_930 [Thermoleophilia bacterium]|nr:hypothetical protein [Thermoleophilia bacterium]